jgi:hypothetical protein
MPSPDEDFPRTPDPVMPSPDEDFPPTLKTDKSFWNDPDAPDPYGPNRAGSGDLPEEFDQYLRDPNSFNLDGSFDFRGGSGGGGKYGWDENGYSTSAMADGGITAGGISAEPLSSLGPQITVGTFANGGLSAAAYSLGGYSDGGRLLRGPGDGVSDSIPATIGRKQQPARLADGEFVVPARIVSELGNGSTEAGARKLYAMMDRIQAARGKSVGRNRVATNTRADRHLPA